MGATTRRWLTAAAGTALALALGAGTAQAAEKEPTGPVQPNILTAAVYSLGAPTIAPPGANDWNCRPSERHPNPVLLSNGTTANAYENWAGLSRKLADAGYCVFAGNFGGTPGSFLQTVGPIADTTKALAAFGDRILQATGATKLDVVGHSQGGMNVRYWIKYLGGADKISRLIGLSPSNHGTDLFGLLSTLERIPGVPAALGTVCQACNEQAVGSDFLGDLNSGGETVPGIQYTVIQTRYDDVVTPYTSAFLAPAPNVKNILLQNVCGLDFTDHLGITYDPVAAGLVLNALDPAHAKTPPCVPVLPVIS
ncbi:Triacylglycerol esterase/lipase EstA, alpha/beta hydrolase fold [Amycolatopsis tolypomycina]|uniref:Triacylglycerol esterase/lipase EstA, alpha/beta hydrolase fold n=1 Tax=Amycolatopsis tolypomycina TaxID=208445 RepID=A0A1H4IHV2_9PSEU|nr:alpha/beta fold hydrolase [Amycolatopsis tolypomycina]SEB33493.1 Triacylglycerol esterase/lipase EstA, alpha/beta hydrolase fold [Amycolatopsis tolypomycina]